MAVVDGPQTGPCPRGPPRRTTTADLEAAQVSTRADDGAGQKGRDPQSEGGDDGPDGGVADPVGFRDLVEHGAVGGNVEGGAENGAENHDPGHAVTRPRGPYGQEEHDEHGATVADEALNMACSLPLCSVNRP